MKYLSSLIFIAGTCVLAWHEALSTVSKHWQIKVVDSGTDFILSHNIDLAIDLISTWEWHISQWLIVIFFTASGAVFGFTTIDRTTIGLSNPMNDDDGDVIQADIVKKFNFRNFGKIAVWGLAPALIIYQFLYPWLCGVVR